MRALFLVISGTVLIASSLDAGEALALRVSPSVAIAPATVVVNAAAVQDSDNRGLRIQIESAEYYRCSVIQLDGDQAPTTTTVRYEGVPGGVYEVQATLFGSGGRTLAVNSRTVEILSNRGQ
jgi:hypothetical protein